MTLGPRKPAARCRDQAAGSPGEDLLPPIRGLSGSWSRATPPARRSRDEIRAPATLVDATFYATADAGSIPAVSTNCSGCEILSISPRCRYLRLRSLWPFARTKWRILRVAVGGVGHSSAARIAGLGHTATRVLRRAIRRPRRLPSPGDGCPA